MSRSLLLNFKYFCRLNDLRNFSQASKPQTRKFRISVVKPKSYQKAVEFMKANFIDDPLQRALGVSNDNEYLHAMGKIWEDYLQEGVSLQALSNQSNEIIGISINYGYDCRHVSERQDEYKELIKCIDSKALKNLFKAWLDLNDVQVLAPKDVENRNHVFEIGFLAVSDSYRGLGLSKELISASLGMAKIFAYPIAKIDCTSEFSAQAAQSLNFDCVYEKSFSSYHGIQQVVKPHTHTRVYAKILDGFLT